jgi:hypothetical protein
MVIRVNMSQIKMCSVRILMKVWMIVLREEVMREASRG